jgi:ornithine carbamoyltransferase
MVAILAPLVKQFLAGMKHDCTHSHYLQFSDLTADEYAWLFERAALIKKKFKAYEKYHPLADRTLAMIFEKASTRTRVSFEAGMYQLGGSVVHLTTGDSQLGRAEPIEDSAKVISRMVDLVMIRTFGQDKIERFAEHSRVPVINGLTNEFHPCQILADIFTYIEHRGAIKGQGGGLGGRRQQHGQHLAAGGRAAGLHGAPEHAQRL